MLVQLIAVAQLTLFKELPEAEAEQVEAVLHLHLKDMDLMLVQEVQEQQLIFQEAQ